jgi:hypothetical protein
MSTPPPPFTPYVITTPIALSALPPNTTYIVVGGPTSGKSTLTATLQQVAASNGSTVAVVDPDNTYNGVGDEMTVPVVAYGASAASVLASLAADTQITATAVTSISDTQATVTLSALSSSFWSLPSRVLTGGYVFITGPLAWLDMISGLWMNVVRCDAEYWPQGFEAFRDTYFSSAGPLAYTYNWLVADCSDPTRPPLTPPPCYIYYNAPGAQAGDLT